MKKLQKILLALLFSVAMSCQVKPSAINYGTDACSFCQMTIVDHQHAAQLVTEKGRTYNYDAIECMMHALGKWDKPAVTYYLIADYANPGKMVDARHASYLVSKSIPSPMGAFLSGFKNQSDRDLTMKEVTGESLTWEELKTKFEVSN